MQELVAEGREPEVSELDLALGRIEYDVLKFDIAMRNLVVLERLHRHEQLPYDLDRLLKCELFLPLLVFTNRVQALPFEHFHYEVNLI